MTFAQSLQGGGVERVMLRLVRGWVDAGQRVTMVLGRASGPLTAEIPDGVELVDLGTNHLGMMASLPGIVRRVAPDIVFCPGNHYSSAAGWLKLCLGRDCPPIVAKVSNRLDRDDQRFPLAQGYKLWLRAHPGFIDHIVAMSPAMASEAVRMTGIAADNVSVIPNPPSHQPLDAPTPPPTAGDYLIGIGRLSQQKRWDRAIAALAGVERRDTQLMILGEGEARGTLENQIGVLGLRERVRLPGYSTNPRPALAQARALVLTSDFEGVPGVIHEALALGTPVVTTDSSVAIREIVSSPHQGSVVPTNDPHALVAALDHWLVPGRPRPDPIPERGGDSIERYVRLFEELVLDRRLSRF
ncbi:glycosyltransferase [Sphingomonas sp.]|uniref:glycosyltransferase n=1 Tax=Sphingomonas sp. TaxID=28214 RepID=UPI0026002F1F|nr:glycosyltransferase [Sphingomonas sp.]